MLPALPHPKRFPVERLVAWRTLALSLDFSPTTGAKGRKGAWVQGARQFGRTGVPDIASSTRTERTVLPGAKRDDPEGERHGWRE